MYHLIVCNGLTPEGEMKQPHVVKSYPHKIQCLTWLWLRGYVYQCRQGLFIDKRFRILEDLK